MYDVFKSRRNVFKFKIYGAGKSFNWLKATHQGYEPLRAIWEADTYLHQGGSIQKNQFVDPFWMIDRKRVSNTGSNIMSGDMHPIVSQSDYEFKYILGLHGSNIWMMDQRLVNSP